MADTDGRGRNGLSLVGKTEEDVAFYLKHAAQGPVLVLGCANARIAAAVAHEGPRVLGVDPSARMIQIAEERRASDEGIAERLKLMTADPRALRLGEQFPVVLAPQNAVGLMDSYGDLVAFLHTAAEHLTANGTLVFDAPVAHPPKVETTRDEGIYAATMAEPSRPVFSPHMQHRRAPGKRDSGPSIQRLRIRHFSLDEMDDALDEAGLTALERYADFNGRPFDPEAEDPLQVVVASRNLG